MAPNASVGLDLLTAVHEARKREKRERHAMADLLVDSWIREAEMRRSIAKMRDTLDRAPVDGPVAAAMIREYARSLGV